MKKNKHGFFLDGQRSVEALCQLGCPVAIRAIVTESRTLVTGDCDECAKQGYREKRKGNGVKLFYLNKGT